MGFFSGLNDEKYDRQYTDRDLVRRMTLYFRAQKSRLVGASGLIILLGIIGAALPIVVSKVVTSFAHNRASSPSRMSVWPWSAWPLGFGASTG